MWPSPLAPAPAAPQPAHLVAATSLIRLYSGPLGGTLMLSIFGEPKHRISHVKGKRVDLETIERVD